MMKYKCPYCYPDEMVCELLGFKIKCVCGCHDE